MSDCFIMTCIVLIYVRLNFKKKKKPKTFQQVLYSALPVAGSMNLVIDTHQWYWWHAVKHPAQVFLEIHGRIHFLFLFVQAPHSKRISLKVSRHSNDFLFCCVVFLKFILKQMSSLLFSSKLYFAFPGRYSINIIFGKQFFFGI